MMLPLHLLIPRLFPCEYQPIQSEDPSVTSTFLQQLKESLPLTPFDLRGWME
jgi:hypothetical protein